ncbi:MAG TPA: exopolyphosphatase [Cyclobacteriaceae bacterium]|nr:exopolyphosphatase [Cyclobacteriaceae bacterium]
MGSRIAIIDLGTNTFHLLIVDVDGSGYRIVHRERQAVKLGKKGINEGIITEEAFHRASNTIARFKTSIDQMAVDEIYAFGTSALRSASNQKEIISQIKKEHGVEVNVISGDEEARLIFEGVKSALTFGGKSLVMDIGGGSVEFIIGDDNQIHWKRSFEIGAQRLLEMYHRHEPITKTEIHELYKHFDEVLGPLFKALDEYKPEALVGSSGTFDTLSDIYCIQNGITKDPNAPETPLSFEGFNQIFKELLVRNREQRMSIPGMIELRVDMIVVACCLIDYVTKKYCFDKIRVSSYALKEGVLADLLKRKTSKVKAG